MSSSPNNHAQITTPMISMIRINPLLSEYPTSTLIRQVPYSRMLICSSSLRIEIRGMYMTYGREVVYLRQANKNNSRNWRRDINQLGRVGGSRSERITLCCCNTPDSTTLGRWRSYWILVLVTYAPRSIVEKIMVILHFIMPVWMGTMLWPCCCWRMRLIVMLLMDRDRVLWCSVGRRDSIPYCSYWLRLGLISTYRIMRVMQLYTTHACFVLIIIYV